MIRVLVAEDHTIVREGIKQLIGMARDLEVAGEACNGEQLLEVLRRTPCDVVLLDISMPDMGGESACAHIRARSEWNAIRVIAYTAHAMSEDADRFRANGFNAVLIKPITLASLTQAMGHPGRY